MTPADFTKQLEGFDWDRNNLEKNKEKHQVHWQEAESALMDQRLVTAQSTGRGRAEARWIAHGKTENGRLLTVVFTVRKNKIRVISARAARKKERQLYEQASEKNTDF